MPEDAPVDVVDTAETVETAENETSNDTCACEAVPDEKFEDGSAETTANVTEDHE